MSAVMLWPPRLWTHVRRLMGRTHTEGLTSPDEKAQIIREQRRIRQQLRRFDMEAEVMGQQYVFDRRKATRRED